MATVSSRIGITYQAFQMRTRQANISVEKLNEILKVMDYKIIIMPSDGQLPEGAIEIE